MVPNDNEMKQVATANGAMSKLDSGSHSHSQIEHGGKLVMNWSTEWAVSNLEGGQMEVWTW